MRSVISSIVTRGGRAGACGKTQAEIRELGTSAGYGTDLDCENISTGSDGSMPMASGTAIVVG